MATYNSAAVSNTAIGFQKPITLQQGRALRDNPIAITEGETNAPYVQGAWHPFNGASVGDGNTGRIWSFAVDGAATEVETPNFANGYEYRILAFDVAFSGASAQDIQFQVRRDDGTLISAVTAIRAGINGATSFALEAVQPRRLARRHIFLGGDYGTAVDIGTTSRVRNIRLTVTSGQSFNAGEMFLQRRLTYSV